MPLPVCWRDSVQTLGASGYRGTSSLPRFPKEGPVIDPRSEGSQPLGAGVDAEVSLTKGTDGQGGRIRQGEESDEEALVPPGV